jgi:hypothetical protein
MRQSVSIRKCVVSGFDGDLPQFVAFAIHFPRTGITVISRTLQQFNVKCLAGAATSRTQQPFSDPQFAFLLRRDFPSRLTILGSI